MENAIIVLNSSRNRIIKLNQDDPTDIQVSKLLPSGTTINELIRTFGQQCVALATLADDTSALFFSADNAIDFGTDAVFKAPDGVEILDVTPIGKGKVVMFLSDGTAYISTSSGKSWELVCSDAPLSKSTTILSAEFSDGYFDLIFVHTGGAILRSKDNAQTWAQVADLTAFPGWFSGCNASIKASNNVVFATCGSQLLKSNFNGASWNPLDTQYIAGWSDIVDKSPEFRQVRFMENDDSDTTNWKKDTWLVSVHLRSKKIIRSFIANTPDGIFHPVCDHRYSPEHNISAQSLAISGQSGKNRMISISGKRTYQGALYTRDVYSTDGIIFIDRGVSS